MAEDDSILPTKGLFFDETLQQLYESSIDQLLKDLGYNITLYLEPVSQDCPNCGVGPNGKSDGRYNSSNTNTLNGPLNRFFPAGAICPVCAGQGKLLTENTKDWTALIKYSPEEWDNEETGIDKTEVVRLKTRIEALSNIKNSVKAKIEGNFYKLEGDPVKKGLQTRTYLSSFWKRIE